MNEVERTALEHGGYELVRVSKELVEQLLARDPQPVVLVGLERQDDGTIELIFRTPDRSEDRTEATG